MSEKEKLIAYLKRYGKKEMTEGQYWDSFVESFAPTWHLGVWGDRELPHPNSSPKFSGHFTDKTLVAALSVASGYAIDRVELVSKSKPLDVPSWWARNLVQSYEAYGFWSDLQSCKRGNAGLKEILGRNHEGALSSLKKPVRKELDELIETVCKPALRERLRKGLHIHSGGDSDKLLDDLFVSDLCFFARVYFGYFLLGDEDALSRLNPLKDILPQATPVGGSPFRFLVE